MTQKKKTKAPWAFSFMKFLFPKWFGTIFNIDLYPGVLLSNHPKRDLALIDNMLAKKTVQALENW
jgi:hypothetical protein